MTSSILQEYQGNFTTRGSHRPILPFRPPIHMAHRRSRAGDATNRSQDPNAHRFWKWLDFDVSTICPASPWTRPPNSTDRIWKPMSSYPHSTTLIGAAWCSCVFRSVQHGRLPQELVRSFCFFTLMGKTMINHEISWDVGSPCKIPALPSHHYWANRIGCHCPFRHHGEYCNCLPRMDVKWCELKGFNGMAGSYETIRNDWSSRPKCETMTPWHSTSRPNDVRLCS